MAGWNPFARRAIRAAPASWAVAISASAAGLVHRLLAPLPFVCFLAALLTDLAFWWTTRPWYNGSGPFWARASVWLIGAGLAIGVAYALVGAYARSRGCSQRERAVTRSTLLPAVGLVLAAANVYFRSAFDTDLIPFGIALSAATAASFALAYRGGLAAHPRDRPGSD